MKKRIVLILAFLIIYVFLLRPLRAYIISAQSSQIEHIISDQNPEIRVAYFPTAMLFTYSGLEARYRVSFDKYFLLVGCLLLIIGFPLKYLKILALVHFFGLLISNTFLYLGFYWSLYLLSAIDLVTEYLLPLCSFCVLLLALVEIRLNKTAAFLPK